MVAPQAALRSSGLSPQAACLATTLWVQATLGLLALQYLWDGGALGGGAQQQTPAGQQRGGRGAAAGQQRQLHGPAWLREVAGELLTEQPVQTTLVLSEMLWLCLRTACAMFLPAPP